MRPALLLLPLFLLSAPAPAGAQADTTRAIVVASKPFGESYLLSELFAQVLERAGYRVDRRPGLGATEIAFGALRSGSIDVYPEYTGTGLIAILKEQPALDPREVFRRVSERFEHLYGVRWLPPLGFQNTYAIAVRRQTAERYGLRTLSDLSRAAPQLTAGFTPDFIGRADGLPGLRRAYAFTPRAVRSLLQAVKYQAIAAGAEVERRSVTDVAAEAMRTLGLTSGAVSATDASTSAAPTASFATYLWSRRAQLLPLILRHLLLVGVSLALAILVAVPVGLLLERTRRSAESVIRGVGLLQTIPGIALLAFMIPLLGIGVVPALMALFLYSLYPILRNTYSGVRDAAPDAVAAAGALGMTPRQVLRHVRLPLAAPIIMAGVRTAAVINVGTATLAAFIGAGGLGDPIVAGLALSDTRMVLSGALPAAVLALGVDLALGLCERMLQPRGLVDQ